jgi:hypothetical protein
MTAFSRNYELTIWRDRLASNNTPPEKQHWPGVSPRFFDCCHLAWRLRQSFLDNSVLK